MSEVKEYYKYREHVVAIKKKNGEVVKGLVIDLEREWQNDAGDCLEINIETKKLPPVPRDYFPLTDVYIKDIKEINIVE